MLNTDVFLERYRHHINLNGFGVPGQEALTNAKVLVVGAGGLGTPVATYLAAMGVGAIGIVEHSLISLSSLPLQPLYKAAQKGEARLECLAQHIRDLNPEVKLQLYDFSLNQDNAAAIVAQYDVVVDATNLTEVSYLLNDACVIAGLPLVYGAAHKYEGQLSVFNFKGGATFRCMMAAPLAKPYRTDGEEQGVLGILPGIIGCYMASEVVKIISGIGEVLKNKLLIFNILKNNQEEIKLTPKPQNQKIAALQPENVPQEEALYLEKQIRSMTPHQLSLKLNYMESVQLIDLRALPERTLYPLEGSLHLPASDLFNHLDEIHQDLPVVLIAGDDEESREIADLLHTKYGFGNIYYLEGGIKGWLEELNNAKKPL